MAQILIKPGRRIIQDLPEYGEDQEGWDTLTHRRIVFGGNPQNALGAAGFFLGQRSTIGANLICLRRSAKRVKANVWEVTAEYKGIAGVKPYKRTIRTFPDKSRGTITKMAGGVPYVQEVEVNDNLVGVSISFVSHNVPNTAAVGRNQFPPAGGIYIPPGAWTTLNNPLEVLPHGWVLDGVEAEELPGNAMCFVRLDYVYYQQFKPGSNSS